MRHPLARSSSVVGFLTDRLHRIVVSAFVVACAAGTAEFLVLTLLAELNVSLLSIRIQSSVVTGVVTGAFAWALLVIFALRRRYLRKKLQVVANLQSRYLPYGERDSAVLKSAERIDKALGELLADKRRSFLNRAVLVTSSTDKVADDARK